MSLYRKYRPQCFDDLLGQSHVIDVLKCALEKDLVSHAYFFTGPRGTGKTSTARILARALNCVSDKDARPCNSCDMCLSALEGSLIDVIEIDAASHGLVDDARALVDQARFLPTQGSKKIYIIDEVHMLSKSAFNALLKIIEEPPSHVHFILATTEAHKVLDTIKSRCQRFDFHLANMSLLLSSMRTICSSENVSVSDDALSLIAEHARGSFRDALSILEQFTGYSSFSVDDVRNVLGLSDKQAAKTFFDSLLSKDIDSSLGIIHDVYHQGYDLYQFCYSVLSLLRKALLSDSEKIPFPLEWIDHFFHALSQLRDPLLPQLALELAVYRCLKDVATFAPSEEKDEKVSEKDSSLSSRSIGSIRKPDEPPSVASDTSFHTESFLESITDASLKSILKHSELSYRPGKLQVFVRFEFELNKILKKDVKMALHTALSKYTGIENELVIELASKDTDPVAKEGLSSSDLESVF